VGRWAAAFEMIGRAFRGTSSDGKKSMGAGPSHGRRPPNPKTKRPRAGCRHRCRAPSARRARGRRQGDGDALKARQNAIFFLPKRAAVCENARVLRPVHAGELGFRRPRSVPCSIARIESPKDIGTRIRWRVARKRVHTGMPNLSSAWFYFRFTCAIGPEVAAECGAGIGFETWAGSLPPPYGRGRRDACAVAQRGI